MPKHWLLIIVFALTAPVTSTFANGRQKAVAAAGALAKTPAAVVRDLSTAAFRTLLSSRRPIDPNPFNPREFIPYIASDLLERSAMAALPLAQKVLTPRDRARYGGEMARATKIESGNGWLAHPETYHVSPPVPKLKTVEEASINGGVRLKVNFRSAYRPPAGFPGSARYESYQPLQTVTANIMRHDGAPRPWVIYLHGQGMGTGIDLKFLGAERAFQRLGVNVATVIFPFHGNRAISKPSGAGMISEKVLDTRNGIAQGVSDVRQMIAWIRATQPDQKIGAYGYSLGGIALGVLASLEPLDSAIAVAPANDLAGSIAGSLQGANQKFEALMHDVLAPVTPSKLMSATKNFHVIGGKADHIATTRGAEDMHHVFKGSTLHWLSGGHMLAPLQARNLTEQLLRADGFAVAETAERRR